jgi:2',3'-cyclic-nucleotide 2'-phosphodiesterase/3'-nucleotidase
MRPIFDRTARKSVAAADPMVEQTVVMCMPPRWTMCATRWRSAVRPSTATFAQVGDDPSVQVVSNAQITYVKRAMQGTDYEKYPVLSAAAPFKTGGRQGWDYYTDIPAGPIGHQERGRPVCVPQYLKAMLLTGAEVQEWIEMSAGQFNQIDPKGLAQQNLLNDGFRSFNFDTLDGVTYEFDVTQPARYDANGKLIAPSAHRVKNLRFQGQPVQPDAKFIVATNNYRAFGGGNFPGLNASKVVLEAPEENRQVLIEYLRMMDMLSANKQVNPSADGNWRIAPVPGVRLTFVSASTAQRYLAGHPQIRLIKDNGDGSALYELVP